MYYIFQKDDIGTLQNRRYVVNHSMVYMLICGQYSWQIIQYVDYWAKNTGFSTLAFYGTSHWSDRRCLELDWTV